MAATWSSRKMPGVARTTAARPTSPDDRSVSRTCSGRTTRSTSTPYAEAARVTDALQHLDALGAGLQGEARDADHDVEAGHGRSSTSQERRAA